MCVCVCGVGLVAVETEVVFVEFWVELLSEAFALVSVLLRDRFKENTYV